MVIKNELKSWKKADYKVFNVWFGLGRAAEYRDTETGMHVIRMSRYVKLLGLADGMSKEETELLLNTALMHDIGKIGIPDRIL